MRRTIALLTVLGMWSIGLATEGCSEEFESASARLGTVAFGNHVAAAVDAPVFDVDCTTRLSGPAFLVQMTYRPASAASEAFIPYDGPQPFRVGLAAGYWSGFPAFFAYSPPDGAIIVQARVWEAKAGSWENAVAGDGKYGLSNPVRVIPEFGLGPDAPLLGLQSFCLVPEPSPVALGLAGLGCWVGWGLVRRFRWQGRISARR